MTISSSKFSDFLNLPHVGKSVPIDRPSALDGIGKGLLKYAKFFSTEILYQLNTEAANFAIVSEEYGSVLKTPHVVSQNPRLDFIKCLNRFFPNQYEPEISKAAQIDETAVIGENVSVGANTVIGKNVIIGENTRILNNVVVSDGTVIGANCLIKSGSVIGEKGFGFQREGDDILEFIHYGKVVIGDNVEIGALNTIAQGILKDTFIGDNVKTDDHIHIAHNISVGKNTLIVCGAIVCGSVEIGEGSWIGPNSSIIDQAKLGERCFVGIGTNVTKSFEADSKVVGNPARKI